MKEIYTCLRCHDSDGRPYSWMGRKDFGTITCKCGEVIKLRPKVCPKCKSPYWDTPLIPTKEAAKV